MKNIILIAVFFFGLNAAFAKTEISVTNVTGFEFYGLHLSDANADECGDDLLPNETFTNETEVTITVPQGYNCMVDIMVTYKGDDGEAELYFCDIDVCKVSNITLHEDGTYTME